MKFFSYESRFSQLMLKLSYCCCLNFLWLICSLPVFTIGASTTALYYVCFKVIRNEETHVFPMFFRSFKENFKQATILWLILLAVGSFIAADAYIVYHMRAASENTAAVIWTLLFAVIIAAAVIYFIILLFTFPLLANFDNTTKAMLKNAFLVGTHFLFAALSVFGVHFIIFFIIVRFFTPLIVLGEGLCAMLSAWLLNNVMISITPEE